MTQKEAGKAIEEKPELARRWGILKKEEPPMVGCCPDCGGPLIHESGCVLCTCGYSECG